MSRRRKRTRRNDQRALVLLTVVQRLCLNGLAEASGGRFSVHGFGQPLVLSSRIWLLLRVFLFLNFPTVCLTYFLGKVETLACAFAVAFLEQVRSHLFRYTYTVVLVNQVQPVWSVASATYFDRAL